MKENEKKSLYESLMKTISSEVKNALSEARYGSFYNSGARVSRGIENSSAYIFATKYLEPICEERFAYGVRDAKIKTSATGARGGAELHRASFTVTFKSLSNPNAPAEKFKVLCKVYNEQKMDDTVMIDFESILGGYYRYYASVIDGVAYYLSLAKVMEYQRVMNNRCVSRDGRFIKVPADFFISEATYQAPLTAEQKMEYDKEYRRLLGVKESLSVSSRNTLNEAKKAKGAKKGSGKWYRVDMLAFNKGEKKAVDESTGGKKYQFQMAKANSKTEAFKVALKFAKKKKTNEGKSFVPVKAAIATSEDWKKWYSKDTSWSE